MMLSLIGQMAERLSSMEEEMESERERWKEKEEKLLGDFNARMGRLEAEHRWGWGYQGMLGGGE